MARNGRPNPQPFRAWLQRSPTTGAARAPTAAKTAAAALVPGRAPRQPPHPAASSTRRRDHQAQPRTTDARGQLSVSAARLNSAARRKVPAPDATICCMTAHPITTGTQTVNAVGPVPGTLDTTGLAAPYLLELVITELTTAAGTPRARVQIEDTANAFTDVLPIALDNLQGPIHPDAPITHTWRDDRIPAMRIGAGSAIRVYVLALEGTTPKLTLTATLHAG